MGNFEEAYNMNDRFNRVMELLVDPAYEIRMATEGKTIKAFAHSDNGDFPLFAWGPSDGKAKRRKRKAQPAPSAPPTPTMFKSDIIDCDTWYVSLWDGNVPPGRLRRGETKCLVCFDVMWILNNCPECLRTTDQWDGKSIKKKSEKK